MPSRGCLGEECEHALSIHFPALRFDSLDLPTLPIHAHVSLSFPLQPFSIHSFSFAVAHFPFTKISVEHSAVHSWTFRHSVDISLSFSVSLAATVELIVVASTSSWPCAYTKSYWRYVREPAKLAFLWRTRRRTWHA